MIAHQERSRFFQRCPGAAGWVTRACRTGILLGGIAAGPMATAAGQVPSPDRHVPELATYLRHVQIAEPVVFGQLAVYPVLLREGIELPGRWLTLDKALARGVLLVTEKGGGGSVPVVVVENRSRDEHVLILSGEVISGGKQTRTVRKDVILAPGQRIDLDVFCVEARRWRGGGQLSAGETVLPQSIQKELRKGADQARIWAEVARNNAALAAENATGSLELALKAEPVRRRLAEVRRIVAPKVPRDAAGFIFVDRGRGVGAEFFGRSDLAQALLPKLLDSYAVDCLVIRKARPAGPSADHSPAIELFERICRVGSQRAGTPGSGAGIRTRSGGLLGDGVSLGGALAHYGVQIQDRIVPRSQPGRGTPRQPWNNSPQQSWR